MPASPPGRTVDTSAWSGDGDFTAVIVDRLQQLETVTYVRVEDAPASRAEATFAFISNEIYVGFAVRERREPVRRFGIVPATRRVREKALTLVDLERLLLESAGIGAPDYADDTMLQYLRTERIVAPYQTQGYKQVEMVRIYEVAVS